MGRGRVRYPSFVAITPRPNHVSTLMGVEPDVVWVELHDDVHDHPHTLQAAAALEISRYAVVGHMTALWHWAIRHQPDGDLASLHDAVVAGAAGWPGQSAAFVRAITDAGFLDADRKIHNWRKYTDRLFKSRDAARERRATVREQFTDGTQTVAPIHVHGPEPLPLPEQEQIQEPIPIHTARAMIGVPKPTCSIAIGLINIPGVNVRSCGLFTLIIKAQTT